MDLCDLRDKDLKIFLVCLSKFSGNYYEVSDLYLAVLREYMRRY